MHKMDEECKRTEYVLWLERFQEWKLSKEFYNEFNDF